MIQGDLIVTCTDDFAAPKLPCGQYSSRTKGKILNAEGGVICAEYVCEWAPVLKQ